jgi:hypothetical protein
MSLRQAEEQAAKKLHAALPEQRPGGIRKREIFWAVIALLLAAGYLGSDDYTDQMIIEERKAQLQACQRDRENAEKYATLLAHVLNGGGLRVEGTMVSCRARHERS